MSGFHPAWSWQFSPEALQQVRLLPPEREITPDWAWGGADGAGVRVAVIDSGIDRDHPAIDQRVEGYATVIDGENGPVVEQARHEDSFGHGTACAGIVRSLAPACELYSVKVLGTGLTGSGPAFLTGLRWAIENGIQVCNLSLGTTKPEFYAQLHELVDAAYFRRIMVVSAVNNLPVPSFPSVFSSVFSVAAHSGEDPEAFYYNPEPPAEFGAPGIDVRVPWLDSEWISATGNSFAAPYIAGLLTRLLSKHPNLTPFQAKTILRALAANTQAGNGEACVQGGANQEIADA